VSLRLAAAVLAASANRDRPAVQQFTLRLAAKTVDETGAARSWRNGGDPIGDGLQEGGAIRWRNRVITPR
jgi:hypothetical protein